MKKYNYYFSCVEEDGASSQTYELLNCGLRFNYMKNIAYTAGDSSKMSCLFLESGSIESDKEIKDFFKFFEGLSGGHIVCKQYEAETNSLTFEFEGNLIGVDMSINNGFSTTARDSRGFALAVKVNFKED